MVSESTPVPPAAQLAELVLSVARRITPREQEGTTAVSLSPLEVMVMRCVDADPNASPSRIAATLGLKSSNASAALRDLEAKGFIRRTSDPSDRRSVRVESTGFARRNLALKREQWERLLSPHLSDRGGLAQAVTLLEGLDRALDAAGRGGSGGSGGSGDA